MYTALASHSLPLATLCGEHYYVHKMKKMEASIMLCENGQKSICCVVGSHDNLF